MFAKPDHPTKPNASGWQFPEWRLVLVVVALSLGLAIVLLQLRAMASGLTAPVGRLSAVKVRDIAPVDLTAVGERDVGGGPGAGPFRATSASTVTAGGSPRVGPGRKADGAGKARGSRGGGSAAARPAAATSAAGTAAVVVGIAHRGASAELPEHTREAYQLAVAEGADFIECDVVLTRDLVPLCRHEPNLVSSTDAAAKYPDRWATHIIDGEQVEGIFSVDLTAEEVATLRAVQPWPFRNQSYNGRFRVATLADYLEVALSAPRPVGIYPETKHPSWTNSLPAVRAANTSLEDILLSALRDAGFVGPGAALGSEAWLRRPVFLQSFESGSLRYMAAASCAPTVLLLGDWEGWVAPDSGLSLEQLTTDSSLTEIAVWAAAVGPAKGTLVSWQQQQQQQQREEEEEEQQQQQQQREEEEEEHADAEQVGEEAWTAEGGRSGSNSSGFGFGAGGYVSSGLVERFHAHGLQVHTFTLRPETQFLLPHLRPGDGGGGNTTTVAAEYELLVGGGAVAVDAVFADHMPSFREWLDARNSTHCTNSVEKPDDSGGGGGGNQGPSRLLLKRQQSFGLQRRPEQRRDGRWKGGGRAGGRGDAAGAAEAVRAGSRGRRAMLSAVGEEGGGSGGAGTAGGGEGVGADRLKGSRLARGSRGGRYLGGEQGRQQRGVVAGAEALGTARQDGSGQVRRAAAAASAGSGGGGSSGGLGSGSRGGVGDGSGRRGWLGGGGSRVWSKELRCDVYRPPPAQ